MLNDISQQSVKGDATASQLNGRAMPGADALAQAEMPASCTGNFQLEQRRGLIAELTKFHEESLAVGRVVKELGAVCDLQKTFTFNDALIFVEETSTPYLEHSMHALKAKISSKIQGLANLAETLCDTQEERDAYLGRLKQQFEANQRVLIEQELSGCGDKISALCIRLERLSCMLGGLNSGGDEKVLILLSMGRCLGEYACGRLGDSLIYATTIDRQPESEHRGLLIPIAEFFDQLDTITVEVLHLVVQEIAA